jgi:hypothetical protein
LRRASHDAASSGNREEGLMFVRFLVLSALALVFVASPSTADAKGRWSKCSDGACRLPPSKIVKSASVIRHKRVVHHTKVIPRTRVVNRNRVVLHRHTVHHRHLTVHKHRIVHKTTVLHRFNTIHRREVRHRHHYRSRHIYYPIHTVEHRYVRGYSRWCNCGG